MCDSNARDEWTGVDTFYHKTRQREGRCVLEQCDGCGEYQVRVIEDVPVVNPEMLQ